MLSIPMLNSKIGITMFIFKPQILNTTQIPRSSFFSLTNCLDPTVFDANIKVYLWPYPFLFSREVLSKDRPVKYLFCIPSRVFFCSRRLLLFLFFFFSLNYSFVVSTCLSFLHFFFVFLLGISFCARLSYTC